MVAAFRSLVLVVCSLLFVAPVLAQQQASISGKLVDPDGLVLPGATVTVTEQNTGFSRNVVTAETGAYTVPNLTPGTYTVTVEMPGFGSLKRTDVLLTAGSEMVIDLKMQVGGVQEQVTVTGQSPLVERTSNKIGGTLSRKEIEEVPSNFRNFTALTQLIPGMTPNPAASTFEGGQVVANGTPSQQNVYLIDGMYNNDDRLGGSQGTQVRVVLDNIEEYQVLSNQFSAEYGGGAGAIINMVTRGGTNNFNGRAYTYFRDDKFNARGHFLPPTAEKPQERTLQSGFGLGGPIVRDRAHFYFTVEKDNEDIAGQKRFPAAAAPLAKDMIGAFEVRAMNYFGRGDLQLNEKNFLNVRWVLETAPTRGEGFNTNDQTIDAQTWESDWDHLISGSYTTVVGDRGSNVIRVGRIGEELATGAQAFFDDDVNFIGFAGRDPFSIGQSNDHRELRHRQGRADGAHAHPHLCLRRLVQLLRAQPVGRRAHLQDGRRHQLQPDAAPDDGRLGHLPVQGRRALQPGRSDDLSVPVRRHRRAAEGVDGYDVFSKDRRYYFFLEDKYRVSNNLTLNLGLRYDNQRQTPDSSLAFAPRAGFAWDVTGAGTTVVRGGVGKFFAYPPVVLDLTLQQNNVLTQFPTISITSANDPGGIILRPDVITDSEGNLGVAHSERGGTGAAESAARSDHRRVDASTGIRGWTATTRKLPYTVSWSLGLTHQIRGNSAVSVDYVANSSRDQLGVIDINEPVNRVRPGVNVFDPTGELIPAEARNTPFARVLQVQTNPLFDGNYKSMQVSYQQADVESLERPRRLHAAAEPLRRPRQPRRAARLARLRAARPTTAASRPIGGTCWRRPARGTRGRR